MPLMPGHIYLWTGRLDGHESNLARLQATLSDGELDRAAKFRFEKHRNRYIAGRAILRNLLARYLDTSAKDLTLVYGPSGKPGLPGDPVHFNVSHSEDHAVFAFSLDAPLGVDVEAVRVLPDALEVAARYFSQKESGILSTLAPYLVPPAFFRCWTRKEAIVKAMGDGLSFPLDVFSVSLDEPARVLSFDDQPHAGGWSLYHLEPASGLLGAIATQAPPAILDVRSVEVE